jgi:hypothetical protein
MPEVKNYLNFSNETPNDHGSIVPNNTIDFERYKINPVILGNHDWESRAIGIMTDIQFDGINWKGIPDFHGLNEESKLAKAMYEGGYLRTASIGGNQVLKTTGDFEYVADSTGKQIKKPVFLKNEQGYTMTEYFDLFEISVPSLPSNFRAATDEALQNEYLAASQKLGLKVCGGEEKENVYSNMVKLSTSLLTPKNNNVILKANQMTDEEKQAQAVADEKAKAEKLKADKEAKAQADKEAEAAKNAEQANVDKSNHVVLSTKKQTGLPKWLDSLIGMTAKFAHPEGEYGDEPITEAPKKDIADQPKPTGMSASNKAEKAVDAVKEAKEKYEAEEDEELKAKLKKEYEKACETAEKACQEAEEESVKEKAKEAAKDPKEAGKPAEESAKTKEKMSAKPIRQTADELAKLNLAAVPQQKITFGEGVSFSKLSADKGEGEKILNRIFNGSMEGKTIEDYRIVLNSVFSDPKYKPVLEKSRFHMSANEAEMYNNRQSLNKATSKTRENSGINFGEILARLSSGMVEGVNYKAGGNRERRALLSTDGSFSSLDTVAVEWLPLIIYRLFPAESWKNDIPIFGVQETGRNLGIIWTNIGADPAIYRGTNPSPAAVYSYSDTAVGVKLVPYWMQPTRWNPLYMHQLRYDQQASGWAQGLAKLEAQIGDDLLYTFGAGVLANSQPVVLTKGPIDNAQIANFTVGAGGNGVDKFYFNQAFAGALTKPGFNDVIGIEQLFEYQNFNLETERPILVVDSITKSYIKQDKQTQSMLTRWINENGADVEKISHTQFHSRSRVLAYDPIGNTIIDTHASGVVIPATTQSANLAFVASQLGIALGQIDTFFVQDPANYGFTMSMDLRIGGRALRQDYTGVAIYAYRPGVQAGQ